MSVYNDENYVENSIRSILRQTYNNIEFIIVNDGSTDKTKKIISKYENKNVIVIENEKNIGLTKSLNKGIRVSSGDYIARIDADDLASKKRIEEQVQYMNENPHVGLLGSFYCLINEEGEVIRQVSPPTSTSQLKKMLITSGTPFRHSSVMIKRECLNEVGTYNENFEQGQDNELWIRIASKYSVNILPEFLCYARIRSGSITSERSVLYNQLLHYKNRKFAQKKLDAPGYYSVYNIFSFVKGVFRGYARKLLSTLRGN